MLTDDDYEKWIQSEKSKSNFGKLIFGVIGFFIIAFAIIFVYYGILNPTSELESENTQESKQIELEQTMQEIKQAIQFQKENPDIDMYCLEKTRQNYREMGIEDLYEQGYQASCIGQKKPSDELDLETFCTLDTMEIYQSLGMRDIYHEIAIKNC